MSFETRGEGREDGMSKANRGRSSDRLSRRMEFSFSSFCAVQGSTKTAILGEAFLNLTNYLSSSDSTDISLPLKRCNSGTVLQFKIQCLGAKKSSGKSWGELSARLADSSPTNGEMDRKSDDFYNIVNKSARSLSGNQDESGNRDVSSSAPKSRRNSNSGDRKNLSPRDNSNDGLHMGRQEEKHSRKLKIELETLKNECADKSKQQAELALELSASHFQQDSLRQEIEELKSSLEDVISCQTIVGAPKSGDVIDLQKETIDEVRFLKESNTNLTDQLNKTQEANIELVSILQELEETIELQRVEMSKLPQASEVVDHEVSKSELTVKEAVELAKVLSTKEDEITMLREKLNHMLCIENADGAGPHTIYLELEKENEFLKVKMQELENDCSELAEENLGLIYKLKEVSGVAKVEDACISTSEEIPIEGRSTSEVKHLEIKCADLELNLLNLRSEFSGLEDNFQKSQDELKERTLELSVLREKHLHTTELELNLLNLRSKFSGLEEKFQKSQDELKDRSLELSELREKHLHTTELELNLLNLRSKFNSSEVSGLEENFQKSQDELKERTLEVSVLREKLLHTTELELNLLNLRSEFSELEEKFQKSQDELKERTLELSDLREKIRHATELELNLLSLRSEFRGLEEKFQKSQDELKEKTLELSELREKLLHATELEGADTGSSRQYKLRSGEPDDTETDLDVLKRTVLLKEQEIDGFKHCIREMEDNISDIQKEKSQLEERLAASLEQTSMTSKCLDEAREDLLALTSSVDSHVSANKVLEAKINELVHTALLKEQDIDGFHHFKREMEDTISDIQKEKFQLEERLTASLEESSMTSKCLDEAREDLLVLTSSVDSHVSANKVLEAKINELVHTVLLKEQDIDDFHHCKREMDNTISNIQKEKSQLEEHLAASLEESSMTSKCLDEAREDLLVLSSSVDSHISANKVLEAKISELVHTVLLKEQDINGFHHSREDLFVLTSSVDSHVSANKVLEARISELVHTVLLKEQDIDGLHHYTREMENIISDFKNEKAQLEERLAASLKESCMTSKCLDEVREDILVLTSSVDSHVSSNKVLETKISELESQKVELESHVSKLEYENIELSQFISELEAQLTSLASENESMKLQLDDSISLMTNINDLVEQQQAEMEAAKLELNSLQTLIADLKKQKLELHSRCAQLEQELDQSKRKTSDLFNTLEFLEAKISTLQKDITLKEQPLLSELENIFQEHKEHEERINRAHFLLNKIENEKIVEVENLEREVMSLTVQLSSTDGEQESNALDSIPEVSTLRVDKAKLEANLGDVSAQMRHYESQLEDLRTESKNKIKGLTDPRNASKQNEETLTTDVEHIIRLMEAARSNEENLRKTSDELELKYKSSDYEKQQVMEEIFGLKIQVNKMASIQDEVSKLQSSLDQTKFEKEKLEELLQSLSEECEELKAQKAMLTDKVSCIQSTSHDADEENLGKSMQAKPVIYQGNDDSANDNGGTPVDEDPDIQSKIYLLETRLAEALEQNKLYRAQLQR
ncbi:unnamed protein product [Alopecurus aequalis]